MEKDFHLFADQLHRCFKQTFFNNYSPVVVYFAPHNFSEVVLKVLWRRSEALQVVCKTGKRALSGGGVGALVVDIINPQIETLIELCEGFPFEKRQELCSYRPKKPFMESFP